MADFGATAVDIDLLEKEIAARESHARTVAGSQPPQSSAISGRLDAMPGSAPSAARSSATMQEVRLDGSSNSATADWNTLDEPVWHTIKRDLHTVGAKFGHVMLPSGDKQQLLRDWDLWGPLFICVGLSLLLQGGSGGPQFAQVFTVTFFGAVVVTVNAKLLGGRISFFQSLCVLGYCLAPTFAAALTSLLLDSMFSAQSPKLVFVLRLVVAVVGFLWGTYASLGFLGGCVTAQRRALVIYPIFLFFFVVGWLVLSHT